MIMRATQKNKISQPVSITLVGKNVSRSLVPFLASLAIKVAYGHCPEENQVSKVSGSAISLLDEHFGHSERLFSVSITVSPHSPQYLAGIGIPHQIWREIGQSRMFSIQWKKVFWKRGLRILTSPFFTPETAISRKLGRPSGSSLVMAIYH